MYELIWLKQAFSGNNLLEISEQIINNELAKLNYDEDEIDKLYEKYI